MARKKLPRGIRFKNGTYEARAQVDGQTIRMYGKDLEKLVRDFEDAKQRAAGNIDYRKDIITLNEWFEEWFMDVKAVSVKSTSVRTMKNAFKRTFGFYIGDELLKNIRPLDVQKAMNAMKQDGIAVRTIRDSLGRLKECMEFAVANRFIPANPCIVIEVPWENKRTKKEIALTQEEQNAILNEVKGSWYEEAFYFMFLTGVRVGELGALKWENIDFKNKVIHVKYSLGCQYVDGEKFEMLTAPKTVNSYRDIPFIGEMEEMLERQKVKCDVRKMELGSRWRERENLGDLVFVTSMGSPCTRYIMEKETSRVYKRMVEKEGVAAVLEKREPEKIRSFHPHTFRHTFATRCFENGMDPKVVQEIMGHSNISVTMNIYTHVLKDKLKSELCKMGNANTLEELQQVVDVPEITALSHT